MKFVPKREEKIQEIVLLMPGTYYFEVFAASEERSRSGNEMIKLTLSVWDDKGRLHVVYDYLLEAMAHKLKHFCQTTQLMENYESGKMTALDCMNRKGYLSLAIQEGQQKDDGTFYPDKNIVKDYITKPRPKKDELKNTKHCISDDEINF